MITTTCSNCGAHLKAPASVVGKRVKCTKCGKPFVADSDDEVAQEKPPAKTVRMDTPARSRQTANRDVDDIDDEEQDRPKAKKKGSGKKGKKQAAGPPVMLLVVIGVGALLLLGGGAVGVYYGLIKEDDKPTTPSAAKEEDPKSKSGGAPAASTAGWVDIHEPDGAYRMKFPAQPAARTEREKTPWGELEIKTYNLVVLPEVFVCAHFPVEDRMNLTDDQILDGIVKLVSDEAKGAIIKSSRSIKHQAFNGREVTIDTGKKGTAVMRGILAANRVIILVCGGDNVSADSPRARAFFASLKIE